MNSGEPRRSTKVAPAGSASAAGAVASVRRVMGLRAWAAVASSSMRLPRAIFIDAFNRCDAESSLQPQVGTSFCDWRGAPNQQRSARANVSVRDSSAATEAQYRSLVAAFTTRLSCACLASVLTLARAFAKVKPGCLRGFSYGSTSPLPRSRDDSIGIFEALAAFSSECIYTSRVDARLH